MIPSISEFGFSTAMYGVLLYILYQGVSQFYYVKFKQREVKRSLIWLGAFGLVLGFVGFLNQYREAMNALSEAGDISPGLVAGSISNAFSYLILGFLILGIAFLFKHFNQ